MVHRKNIVDVATDFDVITTKAREVFYNHRVDLAELCIGQQSLDARSLKRCSAIPVVHILRNERPALFTDKLCQHHLLIFNGQRISVLHIFFGKAHINAYHIFGLLCHKRTPF